MLIAGMGNDLCRDDGFGIAVVRRLAECGAPEGARIYEAGIAGIGLVQELMDGFEALVLVDAVERGAAPGDLFLLESEVPAIASFSDAERRALLADTHYTVPSRALILCRALGILPERVYILGCQPASVDLGIGLSPEVELAVPEAIERLRNLAGMLVEGGIRVSSHPA
jgi:hydrogenase maturation protease